ncbi:MAG TPA: endolytic transglycosylase MltG, partial [Ktedonobacteraceae bacterium]|nr:endolytic transglycosylase MltG [Ktedonobacteraceae bacterium]
MKKRGQRGAIISVLLLGLLVFAGVYFSWTMVTDIFQPVSTDQGKTVAIVVQSGDDARQIADELQAKGLIHNALAFRIWARIKGLDTHLQAGAYNLNTSMTIDEIIGQLLNGQPDYYLVSIPEGLRIEQIVQRLGAAGLIRFKTQEFLNYTKNPLQFPDAARYPILKSIPSGDSMEGLLFPDTYLIPV